MGHFLTQLGISFDFEPHRIPFTKEHQYLPDFFVEEYGFYIETKGRFLPVDRKKHLLIKKQQPHIDIRFAFQNPNAKLSKKSQTTYGEWCDRHEFKWCGKKVPASWFS
jgi:hypothetical protein